MKYKHYSPRARVVLVEGGGEMVVGDLPGLESQSHVDGGKVMTNGTANGMDKRKPVIGVVRTRQWKRWAAWEKRGSVSVATVTVQSPPAKEEVDTSSGIEDLIVEADFVDAHTGDEARLIDVHLGIRTQSIAHYLFIALRELDKRNADIVYVEGIEEGQDAEDQDLAAAIMNRLRKASSTIVNNR
jgi:L-threonylcarbamoyladenylate synthase